MQRRASFSPSPVPPEIQDLVSIRRIHRSQTGWARGIPPFKKRKVGRPALFYFDGSDKSTFEHLTFTDPTSASRNSAVSTKERQNRERAGPQCEITSAPRLATSLRWRPIALPVSTTIEGTRCHIHFSIVGTTASFGATVSANLFATSSQAPANTACDTDPASIDEMAR